MFKNINELLLFNFVPNSILNAVTLRNTLFARTFKNHIMSDLNNEYQYYLSNQDELIKEYNEKVIVIKNQEVVGSFDNEEQAYFFAKEKFELGTFLIQRCSENEKTYKATYRSRVRVEYAGM